MKDWNALRERYLRGDLPVRLGGLAANLARIQSFSDHPGHGQVVKDLVEESKRFIEWTVSGARIEAQAELVELQIQLTRWEHGWMRVWSDPLERANMADGAKIWSKRVLEMSGLLS